MERRKFLEFLGLGTISVVVLPHLACSRASQHTEVTKTIKGVSPSLADQLACADGLDYQVLIKKGDPISATDYFGDCNDYLAFIPDANNPKAGYLWCNHEYLVRIWHNGITSNDQLTKEIVDDERYQVGGSILRIAQNEDGKWDLEADTSRNKRITATTPLPFNWDHPIAGATTGIGTLANCAGGITPWGTILTCEENSHLYYGERNEDGSIDPTSNGWEKFYPLPPEHYGWVVEIDPETGKGQKHIALGRMAHECATVRELEDGRLVVYTGDDKNDEHLYKFIGSKPGSLKEGTLYVASLERGEWLALDFDKQAILQENFKDQTDVLVNTRKAAKLLGATPLDRPEDVEIDPFNGNVYITTTNNIPKGNYLGSILKIEETNAAGDALTFDSETYMAGGEESGFACPDNLAFDKAGNLWITTDMSGYLIGTEPYKSFGNNGLFVVPRTGEQAGKAVQVVSAPHDAELTGPFFSPDGETLFLSVQHPGSDTEDKSKPTSNWPGGEGTEPKSAVVCLQGQLLKDLQGLN